MKRGILTWLVLAISVVTLAGCDLSYFLEAVKPEPPQPGLQMVLQAEAVRSGEGVSSEQLQATREIIERRAQSLGASYTHVQVSDDGKITVELRGVGDAEQATRAIVSRGFIELLEGSDTPPLEGDIVVTELGGPPADGPPPTDPTIWRVVLSSDDIDASKVSVQFDEVNDPLVAFTLTTEGAKKMADFTKNNINRFMPISLDKKIISAPVIRGEITDGTGVIIGPTLEEARTLAAQMKSGALPVNLRLLETTVTQP